MHRMGHSTVRAAMIYQHNAPGLDQKFAEALDGLIAKLTAEREDDQDD
jgi:hypothetical protein